MWLNEIKLINFINKVDIFFRIYGNFESDKVYYFSTDDFLQEYVDMIMDIASLHHEKLDGSGYPFGLKVDKLFI